VGFEFVATIASKLFAFQVEIWKMREVTPFLKSTHIIIMHACMPKIFHVVISCISYFLCIYNFVLL